MICFRMSGSKHRHIGICFCEEVKRVADCRAIDKNGHSILTSTESQHARHEMYSLCKHSGGTFLGLCCVLSAGSSCSAAIKVILDLFNESSLRLPFFLFSALLEAGSSFG